MTSDARNGFEARLLQSLKSIAQKQGYLVYDVTTKKYSTNGANALSDLQEVVLKGKSENNEKTTNIFVKQFKCDSNMTLISMSGIFNQELFVYKELFKIYKELQEEVNIPVEKRFKFVNIYEESNTEAILFENMAEKGFKTLYRMNVLPLKFAELCVEELAKFHSLSFALERRNPDYFNNKIKPNKHPYKLVECFDDWNVTYKNISDLTIKYLDGEVRQKANDLFSKAVEKIIQFQDTEYSTCCFCHGDFMANNILKKEIDGQITEVIPIDYQLSHYGSPVLDFAYFIFAATDQEFRKKHLTNLKNMYYNTLTEFLKYFDLDVESVYPRKSFEKDYKDKLLYGLILAMLQLPFFMKPESEVDELQNGSTPKITLCPDERFKYRVQGLFDDFIAWGYL